MKKIIAALGVVLTLALAAPSVPSSQRPSTPGLIP